MYVSPEQVMRDRAEYSRKGIARGRAVVGMRYAGGVLLVAENHSQTLHKISEIYDRIGFAAVGRYNEFENMRIAGIRYADLRGFSYARSDVTARALANAYAQLLGAAFSAGSEKPYEIELIVAEVGFTPDHDQLYRMTYDGSVVDEPMFAVMGGAADKLHQLLETEHEPDMALAPALRLAVKTLQSDTEIPLDSKVLEVAVLDRGRPNNRKFRRLSQSEVTALLVADE